MLLSLGDPSERVVSAVHQVFIPAFAAWTTELGTLHTALIPSLLARIEKLLMVSVCVQARYFQAHILMNCSTSALIIASSLVPTFCSKENTVWMNTSFTCSCQPCSLSSLLYLLWCYRMHPSPAEPNSMEIYQQ